MQVFQFFVTDDRYSVPSLVFVEAQDSKEAVSKAERLLTESEHYQAIEVWAAENRLFTLTKPQAALPA